MLIFLIGFMGSGKSTTGKKLAKRLGYAFVDTDKQIVQRLGMSVNEIFDRLGEEKFRESEARLLHELLQKKNLVVSTGGGLPCRGNNMDRMNARGHTVYLKMKTEALYRRLAARKEKRPLIRDLSDTQLKAFIRTTLLEREKFYNKARHVVEGRKVSTEDLVKLLRA